MLHVWLSCRRQEFESQHRPASSICLFIYCNHDLSLTSTNCFSCLALTIFYLRYAQSYSVTILKMTLGSMWSNQIKTLLSLENSSRPKTPICKSTEWWIRLSTLERHAKHALACLVPLTSVLHHCITNNRTSMGEGRYWFLLNPQTMLEKQLNGPAHKLAGI